MNKRTLITGVVLAAILAGGILFLQKQRGPVQAPQAQGQGKSKGPADAPVKIVQYSDFQCPACMYAEPLVEKILAEYPGKIQLTYMHYPLPMHQWAGLAHQAAECASREGKFWQYHARLYSEQQIWSGSLNPSEYMLTYANELGIDLMKFGSCLSNPEVTQAILKERASGQAVQIRSTPTFFINGERVVGQIELEANGRNIIRKILGLPPLPPSPAPASPAPPASPSPPPTAA